MQLNQCLICGKWFAQWKVKIYSDDTVEKLCPICNHPLLCGNFIAPISQQKEDEE